MNRALVSACAALAAAPLARPALAQLDFTPFAVEVRAGTAIPRGRLDELDAGVFGVSVGGDLTYHLAPFLGVYAGYSWTRFEGEAGLGEYRDTGLDLGVRLGVPTPLIPIDPWIRAGAVLHRFESVGTDDVDFESDAEWGYEVGAGIGLGFLPKFTLTPQASYVRYRVGTGGENELEVEYIKVGIGLRLRL
ncbi:MAG TPA: outer membrane beta-barrel protein [Longimicrobiaceae bacterium]|nr:outer membrane beta-barrel protein [Longimicrobiaceae bacterium]